MLADTDRGHLDEIGEDLVGVATLERLPISFVIVDDGGSFSRGLGHVIAERVVAIEIDVIRCGT
jgi:hypothetical protein